MIRSLTEQHDIYLNILGYVVHPHIPIRSPNLKVADIGTGSGIWLLELAKLLPATCQFVGYDLSNKLFPPQSAWPQNLSFRTRSILESFPEAELGTYDVVAIRSQQVVFKSTAEWERAVLNVVSLLKQGGWLQWVEADLTTCRQFQINPGTSRAALQETVSSLIDSLDRQWKAIRTLGELCRLSGMVDVFEDVYASDRISELRENHARNFLWGLRQLLRGTSDKSSAHWTSEKVARVFGEAECEISTGVYVVHDIVCVIGRKPFEQK